MIENDAQLQLTCEALADLYQVLASQRAKILPLNPRNYQLIAQGPLEEIRKLQSEIDAYLGLGQSHGQGRSRSKEEQALHGKPAQGGQS